MTKEQAIELARSKKQQLAGLVQKLRPYPIGGGLWAVFVVITPIIAFCVFDAAQFDSDLAAVEAACAA